ncbi:HAMP domain-containing histidine kinase [Sporolactobacillus sp. STSJ-5]|uniref:sensor histidine kinase n=1 Tax=Sporolactobacillus sp. STSJ-5 TaxID=2965076 RepID=UPI002102D15D|nr:HAMP domain-containing sensor histidine kinase [Sporolactobacillus sp. STSJ-5]MCQ2011578.1 HAMP domain-containing histidine kinase [Sporolactobacillus sp. STSJ-5]
MKSFYKINKQTTLFQMNFWYILILLLTVLFIGLAVLSVVSYQLYKDTEHEVEYVKKQLIVESREKHPDWTDSIENILYAQHPDFYVHIETPDKTMIYSKGSESITDNNNYLIKLSVFSSVAFKKKFVPIYHHNFSYNGYTFDLYVRMISIQKFIVVMIKVLAVCTLLGVLIGSLAIYQLSRKLNRPLMKVTALINQITETNNLKKRVPVPPQPREVHDLALSFNQLMDQLDQLIERDRRFVSDASHELRTPLSAIRGHVELIQRHGTGHPEVIERSIHFVDQESKRMQNLIEQLLMIARMGRRSKALETVNLSMIVNNVINDYAGGIVQEFSAEIENETYALANEDYVHQIVVSLLGNARKYTPVDGRIRIKVCGDHDFSYIHVQNSGPSIPNEEKEKIFTRFYRIDQSRSREPGGSGLGLAIVKELVELEEGSIQVEDLKPSGSEFIVRLRAKKSEHS